MTIDTSNVCNGVSLDSYLVGYLHHALNDISDCLSINDSNKAMRITHEVIKYLKDNLQFSQSDKFSNENLTKDEKESALSLE